MPTKTLRFKGITPHDKTKIIKKIASLVKPPKVICFYGDLGSGKTSLASDLVNYLSNTHQEVTSPTFNLVHTYDSPLGEIWHMDLYRLNSLDEMYNLGFEEALDSKILIIEWPQIIEHLLPVDTIKVFINFAGNDSSRDYHLECA